jgi:hypothetical protein
MLLLAGRWWLASAMLELTVALGCCCGAGAGDGACFGRYSLRPKGKLTPLMGKETLLLAGW